MESSPFPLRGVIEAYYGAFYTFPERNDLIRFIGRHGFNFYLYGPKNDRQHRMRWWDPYPDWILDDFANTIHIAREAGVEFCYAISFGVPLNYASAEDFATITGKLRAFYDRGCRSFGVLFDDLTDGFVHDNNRRAYPNVAAAHADCSNRLLTWARELDPVCRLYVCPTEYYGVAPFGNYIHELGRMIHPDIEIFYTGSAICSPRITCHEVADFRVAAGRPPIIWDNYPTNDLQMRSELHLGPLRHRDPELPSVCRGFVSNVMNQKEASKIPLLTIADYLAHPRDYNTDHSWKRALARIGEDSFDDLYHFAQNSLGSCLQSEQAPEMTRLGRATVAALREGENVFGSEAVRHLTRYIDLLDDSCYHLKNRMRNLELRNDLLPWIEALEEQYWMGRRALRTLEAIESGADFITPYNGMMELLADVRSNPKRIGGTALIELAEYTAERIQARGTPPKAAGAETSRSAAEVSASHSGHHSAANIRRLGGSIRPLRLAAGGSRA